MKTVIFEIDGIKHKYWVSSNDWDALRELAIDLCFKAETDNEKEYSRCDKHGTEFDPTEECPVCIAEWEG